VKIDRLAAGCRLFIFGVSLALAGSLGPTPAFAEDARKIKNSAQPEYPDIARRHNIQGSVRLQILVAPDGSVKDIKVLGGNAILVESAIQAVKKWKYQPAAGESILILKFDFEP